MKFRFNCKAKLWLASLGLLICLFLIHTGITKVSTYLNNQPSISQQLGINQTTKAQNQQDSSLANKDYLSGSAAIIDVNNGVSTLNPNDWKTNKVDFANLDNLNRTSGVTTAYLEQRNVTNDTDRTRQSVQPTGWHQQPSRKLQVYNRGHLVAYSFSKGIGTDGQYNIFQKAGDQNNLKNLFTQSAFSNQKLQTIYEQKVRTALRENKKVIYQAQPIFRGNELMARGIHLQAISTDGSLNFNVYIFNVQPGIKFNYATGRAESDKGMKVLIPISD